MSRYIYAKKTEAGVVTHQIYDFLENPPKLIFNSENDIATLEELAGLLNRRQVVLTEAIARRVELLGAELNASNAPE